MSVDSSATVPRSASAGASAPGALTRERLEISLDLSALTLAQQQQRPHSNVDQTFAQWDLDSPQSCLLKRTRDDHDDSQTASGPSAQHDDDDDDDGNRHDNAQQPMCDIATTLFPHFEASRTELPAWLAEVDSAVTAMAATRSSAHHHHQQTGTRTDDMDTIFELQATDDHLHSGAMLQPRIAVGCADGSLWLFGPHETTTRAAHASESNTAHSPRSPSSSRAMSRRTSLGSTKLPTSPPSLATADFGPLPARNHLARASADSTINHHSSAPRRPDGLVSRNSTSSLATRRSVSGLSFGADQNMHAAAAAVGSVGPRPRKASATVSVSAPSVDARHVDLEQASQTSSSTRPASPSLSLATSPTSPTSLTIKDAPQSQPVLSVQSPSPPLSSRHGRSGHSKAKDSIASGIGLWETDSHVNNNGSQHGSTRSLAAARADDEDDQGTDDDVGVRSWCQIRSIRPLVRIRTGGTGEIVSLNFVDSSKWCSDEAHGLLCLRKDGTLSLHSWTDGRCLAACDVAAAVPSSSRSGPVSFQGCKILQLLDSNIALCYGQYGTGFVAVDLDTFAAQKGHAGGVERDGVAVMFKQGMHFLACVGPTPPDAAPPELLVRPSFVRDGTTSSSKGPEQNQSSHTRLHLEEPHSAGQFHEMGGSQIIGLRECADDVVAFSESKVALYTVKDQAIRLLGSLEVRDVQNVHVADYNRVTVVTSTSVLLYKITPSARGGEDESGEIFRFELVSSHSISSTEQTVLLPGSASDELSCVLAAVSKGQTKSLDLVCNYASAHAAKDGTRALQSNDRIIMYRAQPVDADRHRATCSASLGDGTLIIGYTSGVIRHTSVAALGLTSVGEDDQVGQLSAAVSVIEVVQTANGAMVLAGSIDGSATAWKLPDWSLVGRWAIFASPVSHIVPLKQQPLPADASTVSIAVVSANSPVALMSVSDEIRVTYVLPGTRSPVESISTNLERSEIVVLYAQGLARTCTLDGQELRRSMDHRTARTVLSESGWVTWFSHREKMFTLEPPSTLKNPWLRLDLRSLVNDMTLSASTTDKTKTEGNTTRGGLASSGAGKGVSLQTARAMLSHLHSWDLDLEVDDVFKSALRVERPEHCLPFVITSPACASVVVTRQPSDVWTLSAVGSAQLLLKIVCLLRTFLDDPGTEKPASRAIAFYHGQLAAAVGNDFVPPSVRTFASYWLDQSVEISQAARSLFGAYLASHSVATVSDIFNHFDHLLPSRQAAQFTPSVEVDEALLLVGLIATERYSLMSVETLKELAASILLYLDDAASPRRQAIATELCSRDFSTWQHYVDPTALVRQLFGLATGRLGTTPIELRNMARLAVVNLASVNSSLFMTTMLHDIVSSPSAAHRNATLKLLLFMMRKRPLVLFSSLPRVADAVVKSLDPTVSELREAVHQAATVILGELVRTYPSIDFHHKSQRLAVGTHEGSTIVYDLRTATPLYVLEAHKSPVTALSWSPDGHRLISVSLDETKVVVWKVGQGILSMFMPGAPPRQGTGLRDGGSSPYKTFSFHVGDEACMTTAATLEWVVFDWPGDRTARLRIRETAINFGV
ncbi:hypothetical protein ACM66B_005497 [Microbotryomycetes sp. NB124-2]